MLNTVLLTGRFTANPELQNTGDARYCKLSFDGLQALDALFQQIKTAINPNICYLGILPTMTDRTKVSHSAMDTLK